MNRARAQQFVAELARVPADPDKRKSGDFRYRRMKSALGGIPLEGERIGRFAQNRLGVALTGCIVKQETMFVARPERDELDTD